jgi:signal transduction histidine kinase
VRTAIRRSRLEADLVAARENLAYRNHLFAMAVHDLRAPLLVVQGGLEELEYHPEHSDEVRHMLALIRRSADRLVGLTDELADIVAVDQGGLRLHRTSTNLTAVVQQVVDELAHSADAAHRDIHLRCEGDAEAEVDPERISRVLTNLIGNALRHAEHDVDVVVRGNRDHVEIAVQDDGTGVDPDVLPRLFERFVRGKDVRGAGLGLGLAIVRELVRAHGGSVHVLRRGDREKGACFVVDLPRRSEPVTDRP